MSEPADIVAEAKSAVCCIFDAFGGRRARNAVEALSDLVERLQAELSLLKESIESQVFGEIKAPTEFDKRYWTAAQKKTAATAILGDSNPPYPVVPKRPRLTRNAAHCRTCNTTIESKSRHSWVACGCPPDSSTGIYVDGGLAYSRRGAGVNADYFDLCEYEGDKK